GARMDRQGTDMRRSAKAGRPGLHGRCVVITRPVGCAAALVRDVRAAGGLPIVLPGLALRAVPDAAAARAALLAALGDDFVLFTSPAAVRFAARLAPLRTHASVLAVGQGTARALARHGVREPLLPSRQDSEGVLGLPALAAVRGRHVAHSCARCTSTDVNQRGWIDAISLRCRACRARRACCCPAPRPCATCAASCLRRRWHAGWRRPPW